MSSSLLHSVYDSDVFSSLTGLATGPFVTIYSLHRPVSADHPHAGTDPDFLRQALEELSERGFRFTSLADILESTAAGKTVPRKSVCFTLDDGYTDQAELLAPVFNEFNAKATFFVITDFLDGSDWPWDEKITYILETTNVPSITGLDEFFPCGTLSLETFSDKRKARRLLQTRGKDLPGERILRYVQRLSQLCEVSVPSRAPYGYEPMSWDTARKLESDGTIFAPHSCNHYITSKVSRDEAKRQFTRSWERLKEELAAPEKIYCYPTGRPQDFGEEHEQMLASQGYLGAVSFVSTPLRLKNIQEQRFRLPRIAFPDSFSHVFRYASWVETLRSFGQPVR